MKMLSVDKALLRRRLLRMNIVIGLLVVVIAMALMITGEYGSLAERQAADTLFNYIAIGGVLYAIFSWMFCVMSKPFWFPLSKKNKQ